MSSDQPSRRTAERLVLLEKKYGPRMRRDNKTPTDGEIVLTEAEYDELVKDADNSRAEAFRCRFTEPRTLNDQQKKHMVKELAYLRGAYQDKQNKTGNNQQQPALPEVSSDPYSYRTNDDKIGDEFGEIQNHIRSLVDEYISKDKARVVVKMGVLRDMAEQFTSHFESWADNNMNTTTLLVAYINWRLYEYIFCPPGPHSDWARPGPQFRQENGPWVVSHWDVGFGLSAFQYFDEISSPVREHFPELLPEMHELRARMATFIDHVHGGPTWDQHAQALDDVFGKEIAKMVWDNEKVQHEYLKRALKIIEAAFDLVVKLKRSKAHWVFVCKGGSVGTREQELFEFATHGKGRFPGDAMVAMVPALLRVGDEDGSYETYMAPPVEVVEFEVLD